MSKLRRNPPGTSAREFSFYFDTEEKTAQPANEIILQRRWRNPADVVHICQTPEGQDLAVWQYEHLR